MTEWTRETPWRQGHLVTEDALRALTISHSESALAIVASHSCDLVQSPDREPEIEVVLGNRIAGLDGNYTYAKSSRILHIKLEGDRPLFAEFTATGKRKIPKEDLLDFVPDDRLKLSPSGLVIFQRWLASRYNRPAFPDEFERRLVKETRLADQIAKAVKPHGEMITAVFFDIDEGSDIVHAGSADPYLLGITLLHTVDPDPVRAESAANSAKTAIENAFRTKLFNERSGTWKNIELGYIDVISEEALSYRQSTFLRRWRLDHLSMGAELQQPMLADQ
jgi:hypothetical protein